MALPLVGAFDDGRLGLEVRSRSSMATPAADAGLVPPAPHIVAGAFRATQLQFEQRVCHVLSSLLGEYISPPRGCQALSALHFGREFVNCHKARGRFSSWHTHTFPVPNAPGPLPG